VPASLDSLFCRRSAKETRPGLSWQKQAEGYLLGGSPKEQGPSAAAFLVSARFAGMAQKRGRRVATLGPDPKVPKTTYREAGGHRDEDALRTAYVRRIRSRRVGRDSASDRRVLKLVPGPEDRLRGQTGRQPAHEREAHDAVTAEQLKDGGDFAGLGSVFVYETEYARNKGRVLV
jgi:hypothetical protein